MHGKTSTARQASTGGHARHAGTPATDGLPGHGIPRARPAMRVPPFPARQGSSPAGGWPHQSFLELGALPGAVPSARLHTRQVLWEWGLAAPGDSTELAANTELLVSELVTNAMQISRSMMQATPVRLWLLSDGAQVVILVWDASPQPPAPMSASSDAETGRGLLLIEAISARWGWYFPEHHGGKVVWSAVQLITRPWLISDEVLALVRR